MIPYNDTMDAIKVTAAKISLIYSKTGDGRLTSALKETEYLSALTDGLKASHPTFVVVQPQARYWYDIMINGIPINLKLTTGSSDNAFNKQAIVYTLTGSEPEKKNMNFNEFWSVLKAGTRKQSRQHESEYHYLVVDKNSGKFLLKSIMDIHSYKTNPCNILQINWNNEFAHIDYTCADYAKKSTELLLAIQTSIKQDIAGKTQFAEANVS
jgi:hypothetical protein